MPETTQSAVVQVPLTNPGAYTTGQAIGTTLTLSQLGVGGIIDNIRLSDVGQSGAVDIVLYNARPTAQSDRTTLVLAAADRIKVIGIVSILAANYTALGASNGQAYVASGLPIQFNITPDANLYAQLIARGTITYASNDLILRVGRTF